MQGHEAFCSSKPDIKSLAREISSNTVAGMDTYTPLPVTDRPNLRSLPPQRARDPYSRTPRLCARCWFMLGTGCQESTQACSCLQGDHPDPQEYENFQGPWSIHHNSAQSLRSATEHGCEICIEYAAYSKRFVYSQQNNGHGESSLVDAEMHLGPTCFVMCRVVRDAKFTRRVIDKLIIHSSRMRGIIWTCELRKAHVYEEAPNEPIGSYRLLFEPSISQTNTGNEKCLDLAKRWSEDCLENHLKCVVTSECSWYPTRLLAVSGSNIALIETADHPLDGPYATLSHCWGTRSFTTLTRDTTDHFRQGVPIAELLPSFRDAVETVKYLGINYLWIDCFCIIQNSSDWDVEARRMAAVYSNSILNIAAAHAPNPWGGCFVTRDPETLKRRIIESACTGDDPAVLQLCTKQEHDRDYELSRSKLFSRAWVVQERLLSPRTLYFGKHRIFWECRSSNGILREDSPQEPLGVGAMLHRTNAFGFIKGAMSIESPYANSVLWAQTILAFTTAALTFPQDKLAAINGIAECVAARTGDRFVDGFFLRTLPKSLGWTRQPGRRILAQPWRAPRWSWVHWDGPIVVPSSMASLPGELLTVCTSELPPSIESSSTLYCIGKLLPFQKIDDLMYLGSVCLGSFWNRRALNPVVQDSEDMADVDCFCMPTYLDCYSRTGMTYFDPMMDDIEVRSLLLKRLPDGTFQRLGVLILSMNPRMKRVAGVPFVLGSSLLELYNNARPQLVALT